MDTQNKTITYVLALLLIAVLAFGGYYANILNGKIVEQNNTIEELRNENKNQLDMIKDLNENKDNKQETDNKTDNKMTEETIEKLFLEKLKRIDGECQEKLLDYRVESVKVLSQDEINNLPLEAQNRSNGVFALVTYSVKPKNVMDSIWVSGNGEVENDWIINKVSCEFLVNGTLGEDLYGSW